MNAKVLLKITATVLLSLLSGLAVYAVNWQKDQDDRLLNLDKMATRQAAILKMQIDINEKIEERRIFRYNRVSIINPNGYNESIITEFND